MKGYTPLPFLRRQNGGPVDPEPRASSTPITRRRVPSIPAARQSSTSTGRPVIPFGYGREYSDSRAENIALSRIAESAGYPEINEGEGRAGYSPSPFGASMHNIQNEDDLLAELAHGIQFQSNNALEDVGNVYRNLGEKMFYGDAGSGEGNTYQTEGTFEHEAHSKVQPKLESIMNTAEGRHLVNRIQGPEGYTALENYITRDPRLRDSQKVKSLLGQMNELGLLRDKYTTEEGLSEIGNRLSEDASVSDRVNLLNDVVDKESVSNFNPYGDIDKASENLKFGGSFNSSAQIDMKTPVPYNPIYSSTRERGLGGFISKYGQEIGAGLGAVGGAFMGNPMMGAKIGSMAGGAAEGVAGANQEEGQKRMPLPSAYQYGGTRGTMARKGGALKLKGKDHEQGGVRLPGNIEAEGGETLDNAGGGSYAFSKRLTVPGTNMSFADMHENIVSRGGGEEEINRLASLQEQVAGRGSGDTLKGGGHYASKDEMTNKKHGGMVSPHSPVTRSPARRKRQTGGPVDPLGPQEISIPSIQAPNETQGEIPTIASMDLSEMNTSPSSFSGQEEKGTQEKIDQALPYVPGIVNAARGVFGSAEGVDIPRARIPRTAIDEARNMETDLNVRPQLATATRAFRNIQADPNASAAQKQAGYSKLLQTRAQIQAQEENKETQLENRRSELVARMTGNIDQAQAQMNQEAATREAVSQRKAEAAKQNLVTSGIQQMVGARQREKALEAARNQNAQQLATVLGSLPPSVRRNMAESLLPTVEDESTMQVLRSIMNQ